ncbi:CAP domain-containing protein [Rothia nasimurium]|uniref:CAP domain-containing protein n=1 Tax=Rothia nasimurium TaxID=85336 RepID=UPI001F1FC561|nr:CAP domain-containing protein [Rothia nasimurium]
MKSLLETTRAVRPTRRQAAVLTLTGLATASAMTAATAAASDIRTVSAAQRAADRQTLLNLINAYRIQNGLAPVKHSATIASIMDAEAARQFRAGSYSHGTEFYGNPKVQGYSFVSEVIALSYNDDLNQLMNFWKSSRPHREAVLAPQANVMAIGLCYGHGTSLPWRVLGNVGIYRFEAGKGPNDYVSTITGVNTLSNGSSQVGTYAVGDKLASHYRSRGGADFFGLPTGAAFSSINGGIIQNFAKGRTIYWSPTTGAQDVYWPGAIGGRYAGSDFERNWGYPMNSEYEFWGSIRQDFVKGGVITSVYWTPSTGARAIIETGAISARWYALGGPAVLGFPVTDEVRWIDGVTRVTFSSGTTINWTQARGTWVS